MQPKLLMNREYPSVTAFTATTRTFFGERTSSGSARYVFPGGVKNSCAAVATTVAAPGDGRSPTRAPRYIPFALVLVLLFLGTRMRAANLTTTNVQAAGANWTAAIWKTNGTGTAVGPPVAGNTYAIVDNGTIVAGNAANSRVRNPTSAVTSTFPGDSLTVGTNGEFRFKLDGSLATTLIFPGVGGNPGLIVDGGFLNIADFAAVTTIAGTVQVPSWAFVTLGDNNAGTGTARNAVLGARLSGAGTVAMTQTISTNCTLTVSCPTNTFTGNWIVSSGTLLGSATNSLGTNSITVDPLAVLALNTMTGPAVVEFGYDINSAGALTLANGGLLRLHQNCCFSAVTIEGTALSAGSHFYSELLASFPNSILPGGGGSITVQPYGTPPALAPSIITEPAPQVIYPGGTARFSVSALGQGALSYHWRKGGVNLSDGGNIGGATTTNLTVSNISAGDAAGYDVVVNNQGGSVTSIVASLTLAVPTDESFETAILTNAPVAYWQLNELSDPATNGPAFDYAGGFNGIYGVSVVNGNPNYNVAGPGSVDGFPGFGSGNAAAQFGHVAGSVVTCAPLNLDTNTVTICAWIMPNSSENALNAIVFSRGGGTVAGLRYSGSSDAFGNFTLGYAWNDDPNAANWNSQLIPPIGQWSFVSLVVTPTDATIYLLNTNGLLSATHILSHTNQSFGASTLIGWDMAGGGAGGRAFSGVIDEVAVFNRALSQNQIVSLYSAASGVTFFAPTIGVQPASQTVYEGQTGQLNVIASGTPPITYKWQAGASGSGIFTNLSDVGTIGGSTTATLTISNVAAANAGDYIVIITNAYGAVTSTVATLTVNPTGPPQAITLSTVQPLQTPTLDWNSPGWWSDGNPASVSAVSNPGSTYEILPGGLLRSPNGAADVTFPGNILTISGDGVLENNIVGPGSTIGELRFKQATLGTARFKKLVMNGGQLDVTTANIIVIAGEMDVLTNTPIYNDTTGDRGCQIDAWLTGSGTIEYYGYSLPNFQSGYIYNLNITGTSNTFSGKWNVVTGVLLGSGANSLGTNDIIVGTNGVLETTYNINNASGSLFLDGQMFLHQNDTFRSVTIDGIALSPATYTFAQLAAAYPTHFPTLWTQQSGSTFAAGSGSITVLSGPPGSVTIGIQRVGANIQLTWPQGTLQEAANVDGSWTTNGNNSPYTFSPTGPQKFFRVKVQ